MFIECKKCSATYKIEDDKIPHQKSFVRCASCSAPIPLPYYKVNGKSVSVEGVEVECDQCSAHYAIPFSKFKKDEMKVKCGKCGHHFLARKNPDEGESLADDEIPKTPDLHQKPPVEDIQKIAIPDESKIEMDHLFDDLNKEQEEKVVVDEAEDLTPHDEYDDLVDSSEPDEQVEAEAVEGNHSPLDEYLDSVELSRDELMEDAMEIGSIPEDQKYRFFMKPVSSIEDEELSEEISDNSSLTEGAVQKGGVSNMSGDLPDIETKDKKPLLFLLIMLACLGVLAAAWYYFQTSSLDDQKLLQQQQVGEVVQATPFFKLAEVNANTLEINAYQADYFILTGEVEYTGGIDGEVSWLEVQATLFDADSQPLLKEKTYVGNILNAKQLQGWKQTKIRSYLGYNNGREMVNMKWKAGKKVPFQVVFFKIPEGVKDFKVAVSSYYAGNEKKEL